MMWLDHVKSDFFQGLTSIIPCIQAAFYGQLLLFVVLLVGAERHSHTEGCCEGQEQDGHYGEHLGEKGVHMGKQEPTLECRKTLGPLRSINPNMINHFANQSQTWQLLKIYIYFFQYWKETVKSGAILGWTDIRINFSANFSARRTTVWRNPARGLWRVYLYCDKNSIGVNAAGFPHVGNISAITEHWYTKFRYVRYVWLGESLQKHSNSIAKSPSRGLGSQQWSH